MKLVIVSNRLPLSVVEKEGKFKFIESPGGLASGLRTYLNSPKSDVGSGYVWLGWPGRAVPPERHDELMRLCREKFAARPVFLTAEDTEEFYEGFCNQTLWPLLHYFSSLVSYDEDSWQTYIRINQVFCDAVMDVVEPGDLVWVHDYHFLLLPAMLKGAGPTSGWGSSCTSPSPRTRSSGCCPTAGAPRCWRGCWGRT